MSTVKPDHWVWCSVCHKAETTGRWSQHHRRKHYKDASITEVTETIIAQDKLELEIKSSNYIKAVLDRSAISHHKLVELCNGNSENALQIGLYLAEHHCLTVSDMPPAQPSHNNRRRIRSVRQDKSESRDVISDNISCTMETEAGDSSSNMPQNYEQAYNNDVEMSYDETTYDVSETMQEGNDNTGVSSEMPEAELGNLGSLPFRSRTNHFDFWNPHGNGKGLSGSEAKIYALGLYDRLKVERCTILQMLQAKMQNRHTERVIASVINRCAQIFAFIRRECKEPGLLAVGYDISFSDILGNKGLIMQFLEEIESASSSDGRHNYETALQHFAKLAHMQDLPECASHQMESFQMMLTNMISEYISRNLYSFDTMLKNSSSESQLNSQRSRFSRRIHSNHPKISYDDILSLFNNKNIVDRVKDIMSMSDPITYKDVVFFTSYLMARIILPIGYRTEAVYNLRLCDWKIREQLRGGVAIPVQITKQGSPHFVPISHELASQILFYHDHIRSVYFVSRYGNALKDPESYLFLNAYGTQFLSAGVAIRRWQIKELDDPPFTIGCNIARHVVATYRRNVRMEAYEYKCVGDLLGNSDQVQLQYYTDTLSQCVIDGMIALKHFVGKPACDMSNAGQESSCQDNQFVSEEDAENYIESYFNEDIINNTDNPISYPGEVIVTNIDYTSDKIFSDTCLPGCSILPENEARLDKAQQRMTTPIDASVSVPNTGAVSSRFNLRPRGKPCASAQNHRGTLKTVLANSSPIIYQMSAIEQLVRARFQLYPCLEIRYNLPGRGAGVFAKEQIPNGAYVCNYDGKWFDDNVHQQRLNQLYDTNMQRAERIEAYRMNIPRLKKWIEADCEFRMPGVLSVGRYFNHSPRHPNIKAVLAPIKLQDGSVINDVLFIAICDIEDGDELVWTYNCQRDSGNAWWHASCWCKSCNGFCRCSKCKRKSRHPVDTVLPADDDDNSATGPYLEESDEAVTASQAPTSGTVWKGVSGFKRYYTIDNQGKTLTMQMVPGDKNMCAVEAIYRALVTAGYYTSKDEIYRGLCGRSINMEKQNFEMGTVISFLMSNGYPFAFINAPFASRPATVSFYNVSEDVNASKIIGIILLPNHYVYAVNSEHPNSEALQRKIIWNE